MGSSFIKHQEAIAVCSCDWTNVRTSFWIWKDTKRRWEQTRIIRFIFDSHLTGFRLQWGGQTGLLVLRNSGQWQEMYRQRVNRKCVTHPKNFQSDSKTEKGQRSFKSTEFSLSYHRMTEKVCGFSSAWCVHLGPFFKQPSTCFSKKW